MARRAAGGDDHVPPNVISLADARTARRSLFAWPPEGPHAELVAVAALHAVDGEAALVAGTGTILAVNRPWLLAAPGAAPGADLLGDWRIEGFDPRDAAPVITGLRAALRGSDGFTHDLEVDGRPTRLVATSLGGHVGGAVVSLVERRPAPNGRDRETGLLDRTRFLEHLDRMDGCPCTVQVFEVRDGRVVEVARQLTAAAGDDDVVARVGPRELAVLTATTQITDDRTDQPALDTQEGNA
jgi:hypothetical protein